MEETSKLTASALKRANDVYDEALTLFANVNSLTTPEINIEELKKSAAAANKEVSSITKRLLSRHVNFFVIIGRTVTK